MAKSGKNKKTAAAATLVPALKDLSRVKNVGPTQSYWGALSLGILGQFMNPDSIGITQYKTMLKDETCKSAIAFKKAVIVSRIGEYTHEDEAIKEFVLRQFARMRGSIAGVIRTILDGLWAGFSCQEIICEPVEIAGRTQWELVDIQALDPSLVVFNLYQDGPLKNRIKSVTQSYGAGITGVSSLEEIDTGKLLIWSHDERFCNPYGTSLFDSAYRNWFIKKQDLINWSRTLERYGSPIAVGRVPNSSETVTDENGESKTALDYMLDVLDSLQTQSSIAITGDSEITFESPDRAVGGDFESKINYSNKMIYRALLLPGLMESGEDGGSRALGSVHFDQFLLDANDKRNEIVDVLIEQLVRSLIEWNFGERDDYGAFQLKEFKPESARIMSQMFLDLTNSGYLSPERYDDVVHVREQTGLPGIPEAEWKKTQAEKQAKADEMARKMEEAARAKASGNQGEPNQESKQPSDKAGNVTEGAEKAFCDIPAPKAHPKPADELVEAQGESISGTRAMLNGLSSLFVDV